MFTNRMFRLLTMSALIMITACAPVIQPIPATARALPKPTSTIVPSATSTTIPVSTRTTCPNPEGGVCLGNLEPGTYTTVRFLPAITYTVPDGWANLEDLTGNFLLQRITDLRNQDNISTGPFIGVYQNVMAPDSCNEKKDPKVGQSVNDLITWFQANKQLSVTEPQQVTIGGLTGFYIDVAKALDAPGCSWESLGFVDAKALEAKYGKFVPLIIGGGISQLYHASLSPEWKERLYILSFGDSGNVVIEVGPEGGSLPDYLAVVEPVLAAFVFDK